MFYSKIIARFPFSGIYTPTPLKRSASSADTKGIVGDLTTGRAFDSGCTCQDSSEGLFNNLVGRITECHCGAPRLRSQLEFIRAFMSIGKRLQQLPTKELRSEYPTPKTPVKRNYLSLTLLVITLASNESNTIR